MHLLWNTFRTASSPPSSLLQSLSKFENILNISFTKLRFYLYEGGWIWLSKRWIVPKHLTPQLIFYIKWVVKWGIPKLSSKSREQFWNTLFHNWFFCIKWVVERMFWNCSPDPKDNSETPHGIFQNCVSDLENSFGMSYSIIHFIRKTTHSQMINWMKSFQILYKSFNTLCVA